MIAHHFSDGCYIREQTLKANHVVDTHKHNFNHFGLLGSGSAIVEVDGHGMTYTGPCVVEIKAGKVHKITALTDITWFCIHATDVTDPEAIDHALIKEA